MENGTRTSGSQTKMEKLNGGKFRRVNALGIREVEPWHEPVDGSALLDELTDVLRRFVVLPNWGAETLALWVLHTYAFELRDISTYVGIESPEKRCGKTTLLAVLSELVCRPVVAANISSPAFFRVIEELRPTLLIDEADTFLRGDEELKGILNAGYTRATAFVVRVSNEGWPQKGTKGTEEFLTEANGGNEEGVRTSNIQLPSRTSASQSNIEGDEISTGGNRGNGGGKNERQPQMDTDRHRFISEGNAGGAETRTSNIQLPSRTSASQSNIEGEQDEHRRNGIWKMENGKRDRTTQRDRPYHGGVDNGSRLASFSSWCPKVMASIGRLPDTLADRCIVLRMQRKGIGESCERLRNLDVEALRRKCLRFVLDHEEAIAAARPVIPEELNDRAADIWEPLFALADIAGRTGESESESEGESGVQPQMDTDSHRLFTGGNSDESRAGGGNEGMEIGESNRKSNIENRKDGKSWASIAREAAVGLNTLAQESNPIGQLLLDILIVFVKERAERVFSRTMVQWLNCFASRPWAEMTPRRTKEAPQGVTDVWLAKMLRPYGIRPMTIRQGECTGKGYVKEDFMPVFQRYIPRADLEDLKVMAGTKSPEVVEREKLATEVRQELAECEAAGPSAVGRLKLLERKIKELERMG